MLCKDLFVRILWKLGSCAWLLPCGRGGGLPRALFLVLTIHMRCKLPTRLFFAPDLQIHKMCLVGYAEDCALYTAILSHGLEPAIQGVNSLPSALHSEKTGCLYSSKLQISGCTSKGVPAVWAHPTYCEGFSGTKRPGNQMSTLEHYHTLVNVLSQ